MQHLLGVCWAFSRKKIEQNKQKNTTNNEKTLIFQRGLGSQDKEEQWIYNNGLRKKQDGGIRKYIYLLPPTTTTKILNNYHAEPWEPG